MQGTLLTAGDTAVQRVPAHSAILKRNRRHGEKWGRGGWQAVLFYMGRTRKTCNMGTVEQRSKLLYSLREEYSRQRE